MRSASICSQICIQPSIASLKVQKWSKAVRRSSRFPWSCSSNKMKIILLSHLEEYTDNVLILVFSLARICQSPFSIWWQPGWCKDWWSAQNLCRRICGRRELWLRSWRFKCLKRASCPNRLWRELWRFVRLLPWLQDCNLPFDDYKIDILFRYGQSRASIPDRQPKSQTESDSRASSQWKLVTIILSREKKRLYMAALIYLLE